MNLFRVILSWLCLLVGIGMIVLFAAVSTEKGEWDAWIGLSLFSGALILSGVLMLKRKTAGRYFFSVWLIFVMFVHLAMLKFFSEPLVLTGFLSAPKVAPVSVSWGERARILWENVPDNFLTFLGMFAVFALCTYLLCLVHSPRFKESFKR